MAPTAAEALSATVGAFPAFVPSIVNVRRELHPDSAADRFDLRLGQGLAVLWSFVLVALIAGREGSTRPYLYWAGGAGLMMLGYELAFRDRSDIADRD